MTPAPVSTISLNFFSVLTQETCSFRYPDHFLSRSNITEDDIFQLPDLSFEESKISPIETPLNNEPKNQSITPIGKPTIALNGRIRSKTTFPLQQISQKQQKSEESALKWNTTRNSWFQVTLAYSLEKKIRQN